VVQDPAPYESAQDAAANPSLYGPGIVRIQLIDIEPILQENCQGCHRPGEVAPFSLLDYDSAWLFSRQICTAVRTRCMPPWKPVRDEGVELQFERGLTDEQIDKITRWADSGAPEGDPADAPPPLEFPAGDWSLGEPDLILEVSAPYAPNKDGADDYRCFSLAPNLPEDRKIRAIEIQPGNRQIVHHVILFPDPQAESAPCTPPATRSPATPVLAIPGLTLRASTEAGCPETRRGRCRTASP
jgi:hypothetical protein